jgi:hypothetical protein
MPHDPRLSMERAYNGLHCNARTMGCEQRPMNTYRFQVHSNFHHVAIDRCFSCQDRIVAPFGTNKVISIFQSTNVRRDSRALKSLHVSLCRFLSTSQFPVPTKLFLRSYHFKCACRHHDYYTLPCYISWLRKRLLKLVETPIQ